jgi:predicted DNA-binding transcriptional regulator YafY
MVYRPTARVLKVLELLQAHDQLTAAELAAQLEVDERTVRRYIGTLQDIGIPIDSALGRGGGYTMRAGFKLPPLMFSDDEVIVLTIGLLSARRSGLIGASAAVESALAKLSRVVPIDLRERLRSVAEAAQLEPPFTEPRVSGDVLAALSLANQSCRQVRLSHITQESTTERIFDPYGIISYQGIWYTIGYCHLRHAQRTFRLDRIQRIMLLNTGFAMPRDFDALDTMLSSFEAIPDRWNIEVLLEMPLEAARAAIPRTLASLTQTESAVRLRASISDLNHMARTLISLGCPIVVIQPSELRTEFRKIAAQICNY